VKRTRFWDTWLLAVALAMTAFGILMVLLAPSPLFDGFNQQIEPVFWGEAPVDSAASDLQGWVYGVWGATVAGFGCLATFVVRGPYRERRPWARDALAVSTLLWFALDTGISALYGVWFNVAFNCAVVVALAVPVAATWRQFGEKVRGAGYRNEPRN
jgi:hypothetical protein